jgi:glycosyltransferase involved in cell wall biosynthesis
MKPQTILLIGFFRPTKGFHRVVQVFPRILKKVPGARLVIAGNFKRGRYPVYRRDFYQLLRESPAAGRITLKKGPFSQERFARFFDEADKRRGGGAIVHDDEEMIREIVRALS